MTFARLITNAAPFAIFGALLGALTSLSGCKEEDTRLFDETGVWALEKYSLDGTPFMDINVGRKNRFLLRFKPEDGVVAAAACHEEGFPVDVNSSSCTNAALAIWSCQCFAYTYENSTMVWQEFTPGEPPPAVGTPGAGGDTDTDAGGSGAHELTVSAFAETAATYQFDALPPTLFNSNGDISKHVFQNKADTVWTAADVNNDGTNDLDACSEMCFPSGI